MTELSPSRRTSLELTAGEALLDLRNPKRAPSSAPELGFDTATTTTGSVSVQSSGSEDGDCKSSQTSIEVEPRKPKRVLELMTSSGDFLSSSESTCQVKTKLTCPKKSTANPDAERDVPERKRHCK
jgi:hypothetical protein